MENYADTPVCILPAEEMFRDLNTYLLDEMKAPVVKETRLMDSMLSILSTGRTDLEYQYLESPQTSREHVTGSTFEPTNTIHGFGADTASSHDVNNNNLKEHLNGVQSDKLIQEQPGSFCQGKVVQDEYSMAESQSSLFVMGDNQASDVMSLSTVSSAHSTISCMSPETTGVEGVDNSSVNSPISGYQTSPCATPGYQSMMFPASITTPPSVNTPDVQTNTTFSPACQFGGFTETTSKDSVANKLVHSKTKPPYSCIAMITMAIESAPDKKMTLREIYAYISHAFPYFSDGKKGWQNTVRFNLSRNDCFIRVRREKVNPGKGSYWALHPDCGDMFKDGCFLRRNKKFRVSDKSQRKQRQSVKMESTSQDIQPEMTSIVEPIEVSQQPLMPESSFQQQLAYHNVPMYIPGHPYGYSHYYQGGYSMPSQSAHTELNQSQYQQTSPQLLSSGQGFSAYSPLQWYSPL